MYGEQVVELEYVGQTILKPKSKETTYIWPGLELSCLTRVVIESQALNGTYVLIVPITVGQSFDQGNNYYEFYPKAGPDGGFVDYMGYVQSSFTCFRYEHVSRHFPISEEPHSYHRKGEYH